MNTLERYIGKSILGTIFATLLMLVGLSAIIKFVEQFRSVGKGTYDILQAIVYTVLTMPKDVETFFPMAALLGALIALGNLASRSELVVIRIFTYTYRHCRDENNYSVSLVDDGDW